MTRHQAVDRIIAVLERQLDAHDRLLALCERQRDGLIHRNVAELEHVNAELEQAVEEVQRLEQLRQDLTAAWAAERGIQPHEVTVTMLRGELDPEQAHRLERVAEALRDRLTRLQHLQQLNVQLAERGLRYIDQTLQLIAQATADAGYNRFGRVAAQPVRPGGAVWFDGRA